jgi:nitrate reductase gamma subunit
MTLEQFIFGAYPYLAGSIFLLGSWVRFDREQYTWKSDSSQLLDRRNLRLGSNLFHIGVLAIFFGHLVGLLMPHSWFLAAGVSDVAHQKVAIVAGSVFGLMCVSGGAILWLRRLTNPRVRAATRKMDIFILSWIMVTLLIGLSTIPLSVGHLEHGTAATMIALTQWVQSVAALQANPALLSGVETLFKVHMFFGMTVFLLFPFSRLVHIWSVPVGYLGRAYQVVRTKRALAQ